MAKHTPTDDGIIFFDSRDHAAQLALELIKHAHQEICFFGPLIDPVLFDNELVIAQLSKFCRRSPRSKVRFVVCDTHKNVTQSHRLILLAQRLTSKIDIHIASKKHQTLRSMFMLVDSNAYLYCPNAERYHGRAELAAPAEVRDRQQLFDEIWSHSKQDINTRRLNI